MRFYELTLIMILVNVFGAALTNSGAFSQMGLDAEIVSFHPTQTDIETMEQDLKESVAGDVSGDDATETIFGLVTKAIVQSFNKVFDPLRKYILWPALIMQAFGIPSEISFGFTIIFNIIQVIGLLQFVTGRSFKQIE